MDSPTIQAEVVFLRPEEGGRQIPPGVWYPQFRYSPHLVVQDRTIRQAKERDGKIEEPYLGVTFIGGPREVAAGDSANYELRLDYYPDVDYSALIRGASFTVREGGKIVGHGIVLGDRVDVIKVGAPFVP